MAVTVSEEANTIRLASLSSRIAGALERRMKGKPAIEGDSYVMEQGRALVRSLRDGGFAVAGDVDSHVDDQAIGALPAAITVLSDLNSELCEAQKRGSEEFREMWDRVIGALGAALSIDKEADADLEFSIAFFDCLWGVLSRDLHQDPAPPEDI